MVMKLTFASSTKTLDEVPEQEIWSPYHINPIIPLDCHSPLQIVVFPDTGDRSGISSVLIRCLEEGAQHRSSPIQVRFCSQGSSRGVHRFVAT